MRCVVRNAFVAFFHVGHLANEPNPVPGPNAKPAIEITACPTTQDLAISPRIALELLEGCLDLQPD